MPSWTQGSVVFAANNLAATKIRFDNMNVPQPTQVTLHVESYATGGGCAGTSAKLYVSFFRNGQPCHIDKHGNVIVNPGLPIPPTSDDTHPAKSSIKTELSLMDPNAPNMLVFRPGDDQLVAHVIYSQSVDVDPQYISMKITSYGPV